MERPGRGQSASVKQSRLPAGLQRAQQSDKPVLVDVHGDTAKIAAAVRAAGGRVRATTTGALTATVPGIRLAQLAADRSVSRVSVPERPVEYAVSQGVGLSGASTWQGASLDGTGVKIAIIDGAFANLPAGIAAGQTNYCTDPNSDPHGSAVAEIIHEMAPKAQLYLYCVDTAVEVNTAEQAILKLGGVRVISSSLGWPGDSRGDGTGAADSVAHAVKDARAHNILWVNSAGNNAEDHWWGQLSDTDGDGLVDVNGTGEDNESDEVLVGPGDPAFVSLWWDNWPTSSYGIEMQVFGFQCTDAQCSNDVPLNSKDSQGFLIPFRVDQAPNTSPWLGFDLSNSSAQPQLWQVFIADATPASVRYDLSFDGGVSPSYLSSKNPAHAAAGSIDSVAQSPYAMAVGAVDASGNNVCQDDSTTVKTVTNLPFEQYSSQGPAIDGRPKPDIAGYDGTSSDVYGEPFCGTSAAAPHVAAAAALVAEAHPTFNAAEVQTFLQKRANNNASYGPSNALRNSLGTGVLTLGQTGTSGTCSISVPPKVYIGAATAVITATVGSDCATAGMSQAQWNIVPSNVSAGWTFTNSSTSASYLFQANQDTVGALQVQPGGASTPALYGGIAQNSTSFAAKYTTLVYSASSRSGSAVYVNGLVHQWSAHGSINPNGISVWLQRYIGGHWQTMLARTAAAGHVSVGFVQTTVYQYRWVVLETATAWSGSSASTVR